MSVVVKLFKLYVEKNGKRYVNFYNAWKHNDRTYLVRVFPQFVSDFKLMVIHAKQVDNITKISELL